MSEFNNEKDLTNLKKLHKFADERRTLQIQEIGLFDLVDNYLYNARKLELAENLLEEKNLLEEYNKRFEEAENDRKEEEQIEVEALAKAKEEREERNARRRERI